MQPLNRKASLRRPVLTGVLACVLTGAFGLLSASMSLAAGAPPPPPPKAAVGYPPDPNDPTPPQEAAQVQPAAPLPPADPAQVAQGQQLFKAFCQKCHGIDMVSPGPPFYDLRGFPHDEKPRFINSVTNGKRAMPAWGAIVKPVEIESLWAYVASYKQQ